MSRELSSDVTENGTRSLNSQSVHLPPSNQRRSDASVRQPALTFAEWQLPNASNLEIVSTVETADGAIQSEITKRLHLRCFSLEATYEIDFDHVYAIPMSKPCAKRRSREDCKAS